MKTKTANNTYIYSFNSQCPNNEEYIYYTIKIKTKKMIMVETIKAECLKYKKDFHECIADGLFKRFSGKQILTATHHNVKIKTLRK